MCVLVGYGADAICPYMVFEIAQMLREENVIEVDDDTAYENYAAAVDRGISKVLTRGKSFQDINYADFFHHFTATPNLCPIQGRLNKAVG